MEIREAIWTEDEMAIRQVREPVFVIEQNVPEELDFDGTDEGCRHILAFNDDGQPIGTGRIMPDGHIGRMAVLKEYRGHGIGTSIMQAIIELGQNAGIKNLHLGSQDHAIGFYEQLGFKPEGPIFMDAGIPHRNMTMTIK